MLSCATIWSIHPLHLSPRELTWCILGNNKKLSNILEIFPRINWFEAWCVTYIYSITELRTYWILQVLGQFTVWWSNCIKLNSSTKVEGYTRKFWRHPRWEWGGWHDTILRNGVRPGVQWEWQVSTSIFFIVFTVFIDVLIFISCSLTLPLVDNINLNFIFAFALMTITLILSPSTLNHHWRYISW